MKSWNKIVAALLAVILAAGLLAGCGSNATEASTEAPAAEPEVPEVSPEEPETDPSESVDVPEELPEEEASSISRPRPTNPPKTSSSTSGKKPSSSAGQGTTTESGLTEIADGEVPLYGGMQTGDGTIYGAVALAMMSVLLLAGAVVCKVRG